jgi:hypothetical protein
MTWSTGPDPAKDSAQKAIQTAQTTLVSTGAFPSGVKKNPCAGTLYICSPRVYVPPPPHSAHPSLPRRHTPHRWANAPPPPSPPSPPLGSLRLPALAISPPLDRAALVVFTAADLMCLLWCPAGKEESKDVAQEVRAPEARFPRLPPEEAVLPPPRQGYARFSHSPLAVERALLFPRDC